MGKSKAPPPPDYAAAAKEQGVANLAAGQQTAALNRPTQIDRNGQQNWSLKEGADPKNPQPGDWIVTNTLSDTQENLAKSQDDISQKYAGLAGTSLDQLKGTMGQPVDVSGLPKAASLDRSGLNAFGNIPTAASNEFAPDVERNRQRLSDQGLSQFGHVDPTTENSRQRITEALYGRQTAMLDPRMKQQRDDLTSRLAAQGITEGSEAYDRAVGNQQRAEADEYTRAREAAILAGGAEDTRIGNQNLNVADFQNRSRGQQFDERGQMVGVDNSNIDTLFGQGLARAGFNNDVRNTQFAQQMQGYGANADTRRQQFGENSAITAANNTLHGNALAEALQLRQTGLNEANALRTGNQVGNYNFQAYGGAGQVDAAPTYQATADSYNAQLAANNANNANVGGIWSGLTNLGSAFIRRPQA